MNKGSPLLAGTLDMLILHAVADDPRHGYAIMRKIRADSGHALGLEEGSLYPALHRLVRRKLLSARWGESENRRRARFYALTAAGRGTLERERSAWDRVATAVNAVLAGGPTRARRGTASMRRDLAAGT